MKTRQRTGHSARACISVGQSPCLDARHGAMPSSGHFQHSSLLLSLGLCPLGSSNPFFIHGSPSCHLMDVGPVSLFDCPAQPSNIAGAQPRLQHPQPCPGPRCPGETNPIILVRPDSTPLFIQPQTANTKKDSCLFFQAWRTQEAVLAVRPFLKALSDAAVCNPSSIFHVGWRSPTAEVRLPQVQTPRDVLC